jgi:hypothetical protein
MLVRCNTLSSKFAPGPKSMTEATVPKYTANVSSDLIRSHCPGTPRDKKVSKLVLGSPYRFLIHSTKYRLVGTSGTSCGVGCVDI